MVKSIPKVALSPNAEKASESKNPGTVKQKKKIVKETSSGWYSSISGCQLWRLQREEKENGVKQKKKKRKSRIFPKK